MIKFVDVSGKEKYINGDHIEKIEKVPDTLITLTNGNTYISRDTPELLIERIVDFRKRYHQPVVKSLTSCIEKVPDGDSVSGNNG